MWNSASTSSDLAKGKKYLEILKYVQHVDKEKNMTSEISEQILLHLLADDRRACHDSNSTENVGNPESNLDILKSFLKDRIIEVVVFSNPLPIPIGSSERVTFHAFVVFSTRNTTNSEKTMCWTLEKNGKYIVLQQSTNQDDVLKKIYDAEKNQSVERHGEVKLKKIAYGNLTTLKYLLQVIWEYNQISDPYHLLYSNCQQFASFIFEKLNGERENWSTNLSAAVDRFRRRQKKAAIEVNTVMYNFILNDDKFDYYKAMMDGRMEDFEQMTNNLTIETLNSVDTRGNTLLEWATVFSSSDWQIDEELKKKGAEIRSDKGSFRRNLFFIALQYLPPNQNSTFLSFDEIDIHGVNQTGDTALHLALYGEKWKIAEEILNRFEDVDVNSTNSLGEKALHLAAKLKCEFGLFKKILNRTNSENVNKTDGNGSTALHYAIDRESEIKVKELLNRTDVDVNIQNMEDYYTALHLASKWPNIPADLFEILVEKSTSDTINAHDIHGNPALHYAIMTKSETAVKELLKHTDVNVTNNQNVIALHIACSCENFPTDLFKLILEKITDINAQDEEGATPLYYAIINKSGTKLKELLEDFRVDVNVKNKNNFTALNLACFFWKDIPVDLFKIILDKSKDVINEQDEEGETALHYAIWNKSEIMTKALLAHSDVDVKVKNNYNETALHLASKWPNIPADLFEILVEKSTDINAQTEDGNTALHYAILYKSEIALQELLAHSDVDVDIKNKDHVKAVTALHLASEYWKDMPMDLFKIILQKSTDINAQDKDGYTALHFALHSKSETKVKQLLAHSDVDVNIKGEFYYTPLHLASEWKDIPADLFKKILEKTTDVNAQDEDKRTSLHLAILQESKTHVEELLKNKDVNVNVKDNGNQTSLHLASCWKEIPMDLFKIIIKSSTDVNAQDKDGNTALHIAFRSNSQNAITALHEDDRVDVKVKNKENRSASDYF